MKIQSAEYIISAAHVSQFPKRPIPHFVFAGRSNVGKSSLLNKLTGRKGLAKISSKPGKTRLINFFLINDRFYFVDLPGYGFARVSKTERQSWQKLIERYFVQSEQIRMIFSLIDSRHEPTSQDLQLQDWLGHYDLPFMAVLTKADKMSRGKAQKQASQHARILQLPKDRLLLTSAQTGAGIPSIWDCITTCLDQPNPNDRNDHEYS